MTSVIFIYDDIMIKMLHIHLITCHAFEGTLSVYTELVLSTRLADDALVNILEM